MKRVGLTLAVLMCTGFLSFSASAEDYDFDLTKMSLEELNNFESDVKDAKDEYHDADSNTTGKIRDAVKKEVESYYSDSDISWAWIDYDYTKDWDYYTFSTHMDHTEGEGSKQRAEVYAELFYKNKQYEIFYLKSGDDVIIDNRKELPDQLWDETPKPLINETTGLDLSVLTKDELNDLKNKIDEEISADHKTDSTTTSLVLSLAKYTVEENYNDVSWPWFDYDYTNEWGFYTLETSISYKDENDDKQNADVYAEAYPTNGDYELYYLSVDDDILIDKRAELPDDFSSPETSKDTSKTSEPVEPETEATEAQTKAAEEETETAETETKTEAAESETKEPDTEALDSEAEEIETDTSSDAEPQTEEGKTAAAPDSVLTGTIVEATMNTITVQAGDGTTYLCTTEDADFDLASGGIMLGMEVDVTLESTASDENGLFTAKSVTEINETEEESEAAQGETNEENPGAAEGEENDSPEEESEKETEKTSSEEDTVLYEKGSSGDEIKEVQEKLIELGFLNGSADGSFGSMTEEALRAFQEEKGLEVSGAITSKTLAALNRQGGTQVIEYEGEEIEAVAVDADILYQYAEYFSGTTVYTAFKVDSVSDDYLSADTESNSSIFHYSIHCDFDDPSEIKGIKEDDVVAVVGTSSGDSYSTLSNSHIISTGEEAQEVMNELAANTSEQIDYALGVKATLDAEQDALDAADKQTYIDSCISVNYSDVERDPDQYKGTNIQVSGSVIQVSEGWFNSVTMRVQQSDGNIWYVTYTRDDGESRILEGDYVTIYGTCDGVESYTSVLGASITIPSVKAEYIN